MFLYFFTPVLVACCSTFLTSPHGDSWSGPHHGLEFDFPCHIPSRFLIPYQLRDTSSFCPLPLQPPRSTSSSALFSTPCKRPRPSGPSPLQVLYLPEVHSPPRDHPPRNTPPSPCRPPSAEALAPSALSRSCLTTRDTLVTSIMPLRRIFLRPNELAEHQSRPNPSLRLHRHFIAEDVVRTYLHSASRDPCPRLHTVPACLRQWPLTRSSSKKISCLGSNATSAGAARYPRHLRIRKGG